MCDYALEVAEIRKYTEECRRQYNETGSTRCPYEKDTLAWFAWGLEILVIQGELMKHDLVERSGRKSIDE